MIFESIYNALLAELLEAPTVDVGEWHAMDVSDQPNLVTHEVRHATFELHVPETLEDLQFQYRPNLPWADEHFDERVSGRPLNPPPSHERWPYAMKGNDEHISSDGRFSHSYPERYWPRWPIEMWDSNSVAWEPRRGIWYELGDLDDLVKLLSKNPMTRQAYLPVWFPEDLTAANLGERVPCSLGYHFLMRNNQLHCDYSMRSCDFVRHFRDDMYHTARLMQWVRDDLENLLNSDVAQMGDLVVHISSLHCMEGDMPKLRREYENLSR